jgi:hypothetical protein
MSKKVHGNKEAKKPKRAPPVASSPIAGVAAPVVAAVHKPQQGTHHGKK